MFLSKPALWASMGTLVVATALLVAPSAQAQERTFDIPASSADKVLPEFARQAHIQVIAPQSQLANVKTPALKGRMDVREGLKRLLVGSGLEVASDDDDVITLRPTASKPTPARQTNKGAQAAPTTATSNAAAATSAAPPPSTNAETNRHDHDQAQALEAVNVSASRIDFANTVAVTPTISFTPESLRLSAYNNVGDALYDLPYFSADRGPGSTGTNVNVGASPIDLRGLGVKRTLLLVDGHRISGNTLLGGNDLNSIPSILIKDLQVVTGGASASWGSGAVAGVVNVLLDHNFTGLKFDASYGQSSHSDDKTRSFQALAGSDFADGEGHVQLAGEFLKAGGILKRNRSRAGRWALLPVDGTQDLAFTPNVGLANQSLGGLILTGPLKGQAFGPDGTLHTHKLDRVVGTSGVGNNAPSSDDFSYLITPRKHYTILGSLGYNLNDNLRLTTTLRYFQSNSDFTTFSFGLDNLNIDADNVFLNDSIKKRLINAGVSSFNMGRFRSDINYPRYVTDNHAHQETLKLDGTLNDGWRWTSYFSHGVSDIKQDTRGLIITEHLRRAVDAIADPVTGAPICRTSLNDPASQCIPIDLFGNGAPSEKAQRYITGPSKVHRVRTSDEGGVSFRGEPWEMPAGFVGVALGAEGRHVSVKQDVGRLDAKKALQPFFASPEHGAVSVLEGFGEINIPLIYDKPGARDLAADLAARVSHYSTSGNIWTWKVGVTNEFIEGFRARMGYSRDIRAPDLSELYEEQGQGANPVYDPVLNESYDVKILLGGNPNLNPEKANTLTLGLSWRPSHGIFDGLLLSADYFNVDTKDVITTINTQATVNRCRAGNSALCARIVRGSDGRIEHVNSESVNLAEFKEDGIDLEVGYSKNGSLFGANGEYRLRILGTWVHKLTVDDGLATFNYVGAVGSSWVDKAIPRWRGVMNFGFSSHQFSLHGRMRYFSAGYHQMNTRIVNNRISQYFYVDIGGSYELVEDTLELFGQIRNVNNKRPPIASSTSPYYDAVGRFAKIGLRLNF